MPAPGLRAPPQAEEIEEVQRTGADDFDYVRTTMALDLVHIVRLLQDKSDRALPFAKGTNPAADLRWIFVGYDCVPGPLYIALVGIVRAPCR